MCRHLAWLGEPRSLAALILEPASGLLAQSYAPRRQCHGTVNADGWGVGFYSPGRSVPARWRSARPLWTDASFASVAPVISSSCVLAAVRSATVGMPIEETAAAPFASGEWLLSHNGIVDRSVLPPDPVAESVCDSAVLAAFVFAHGPERVAETVVEVARRDPAARLNLLLTNGREVLATISHSRCRRALLVWR
jgi:gamma-glutamyl hercynylcysteine S-oxide hydrolase